MRHTYYAETYSEVNTENIKTGLMRLWWVRSPLDIIMEKNNYNERIVRLISP